MGGGRRVTSNNQSVPSLNCSLFIQWKYLSPHIFSDTVGDLIAKKIGSGQISQRNRNMAATVKKNTVFSHAADKKRLQRNDDISQTAMNLLKRFLGYLSDLAGEKTHVFFSSNSPLSRQIMHLKLDIFSCLRFSWINVFTVLPFMNLLHSAFRSISEGEKLFSDVIIAYDPVNFSDIASMDWAGCANSYATHILASKALSILREQKNC